MELDTNRDLFPEGKFRFRISEVPEEGVTNNGNYPFFKFSFMAPVEGEEQPYQERFMRWTMGPLCRALGFKETRPGKFIFEPTECLGREVEATIAHEKIEKGASAGQVVARMKDIKPVGQQEMTPGQAALKAQAPSDDDVPF